ncbi:MAG: glycosyltransferase [Abitibacteriaceae bacterium]|nr:glycosyltransferase [Abditibacteriaceae bacterium]
MNQLSSLPVTPATVSVVVPVFNEEVNIREFIQRTLAACRTLQRPFEIILIDDGSKDASTQIIAQAAQENPGEIVGIVLNRNYGQHSAIMAGFNEARGDVVITLDADLQNPPEEIPNLVAKTDEGYDVVGTIRLNREDSTFRKMASSIINKVTAKATGVMMHDYGCMLRAYSRSVVQAMLQCHERSTFIPVLANSFAGNTTEIEVKHAARGGGESKYSLWKLINLQFDLLTSITTFPLRLLSILGTFVSLLGISLGLLLLIGRLAYGHVWANEGTFTLFALLFIFVGLQFIGMGLLGEYIGRIYHDVRARPRYFVRKVEGHSQLHQARLVTPDSLINNASEVAALNGAPNNAPLAHASLPHSPLTQHPQEQETSS